MINLRKLVERKKNQRAEKIKNRILKQTHVIKLAESLSPITKKLDEVKKSTQDLGDVIKASQLQAPQLAIGNTPTTHQPIEKIEGTIYDVEIENTLKNMEKDIRGFFKTHHDPQSGWIINKYPNKTPAGTEVEISGKKI